MCIFAVATRAYLRDVSYKELKPLTKQNYTVIGPPNLKWSITLPASNNKEIKDVLKYNILEDGSIDVTWTAMISGSYILHYGMLEKTIVVESLF